MICTDTRRFHPASSARLLYCFLQVSSVEELQAILLPLTAPAVKL